MASSKLTEYELQSKLDRILFDEASIFPSLTIIGSEIPCREGISDMVAASCTPNQLEYIKRLASLEGLDSSTKILSLLKENAPRTFEYLIKKSNYKPETVRLAIRRLSQAGLIKEIDRNRFLKTKSAFLESCLIYSFEVKLSDIKRALFQAMQHKVFADYSYVVFPLEKRNALLKHREVFDRFSIGILLYSEEKDNLVVSQRAKKSTVTNNWSRLYTLGKLKLGGETKSF
jgi:predicted transcriptional regulator